MQLLGKTTGQWGMSGLKHPAGVSVEYKIGAICTQLQTRVPVEYEIKAFCSQLRSAGSGWVRNQGFLFPTAICRFRLSTLWPEIVLKWDFWPNRRYHYRSWLQELTPIAQEFILSWVFIHWDLFFQDNTKQVTGNILNVNEKSIMGGDNSTPPWTKIPVIISRLHVTQTVSDGAETGTLQIRL